MEVEVDRCHRGLPVMRMNDVERQTWDQADPQRRRRRAQASEADPVVGPLGAVRADIRIAGACEQMRRVDHQQIERGSGAAKDRRRTAEQVGEFMHRLGVGEGVQHGGIARHQGGCFRAGRLRGPVAGRRSHRQTARLHQREDFRGDGQHADQKLGVQAIDHGLRDQANPAFGAAEPSGVLHRVLSHHKAGRYFHASFHDHVP